MNRYARTLLLLSASLIARPALAGEETNNNNTPAKVEPAAPTAQAKAGATSELPEMVTDRPDFTESSEVVGKNVMQVEFGMAVERDRANRSKTMMIGTPLMRWGLAKRFELRIGGGEGFLAQRQSGERYRGFADGELGFKYKIQDETKWFPALGIISSMTMPVGAAVFTSTSFDPGFKVTWSKEVPGGFGLSGNLNGARITTDEGRFFQKAVTLSAAHDLVAGFGGYWEAFAFTPYDKGTGPNWIFDTGITRGVGRNAQLDVTYGHRVNAIGPDWFVAMGFSYRRRVPGFFGF